MYLADMFTAGPNELDNIDNMARSFNQPLTTITHQTLVFGGAHCKDGESQLKSSRPSTDLSGFFQTVFSY